jgi:hypothetical protein
MPFPQFVQEPFGHFDVPALAALVTAAKQNDLSVASLLEINAIPGAMVDAKFADPVADRLNVPGMSVGKTIETGRYQGTYAVILQPCPPFAKRFCLPQLEHRGM